MSLHRLFLIQLYKQIDFHLISISFFVHVERVGDVLFVLSIYHKLPFKNQYACWNVVRSDVDSSKRGRPDIGPKISKAQATRIRKA